MTRTTLPAANATITRIAGGGVSEDFDRPAGPDTVRWQGEADAYRSQRTEQVARVDTLDIVTTTTVVVPIDIAQLVQIGDTISLSTGDEMEQQMTVTQLRLNPLGGTGRLWLTEPDAGSA
jgi:hypothetical protein